MRFSNLFRYSHDGIIVHDLQGMILDANEKVLRLLDYKRQELLFSNIASLHQPGERAKSQSFFADIPRRGHGELEIAFQASDGRLIPTEVTSSVFEYSGEQVIQSVIRDISERVMAEKVKQEAYAGLEQMVVERTRELAVANRRLQELDQLKNLFIASMSHELRTPLNAIIGFTGVIQMEVPGPLNEEQKKQLAMVRTSAQHLLALINDIIDVSAIEAGSAKAQWERFDLVATVKEVFETVQATAEEKSLIVCMDAPAELEITSDERRVKQVLINLLSNAVKFSERGQVTVRVHGTDSGTTVAVHDQGVGISEDDMGRLFQPFSRIETDDGPKLPGTGLGLHLSRKIAILLGGRIEVSSARDEGSVFSLFLPADVRQQREEARAHLSRS
jgi:PAS domain S-box-containing protein